MSELKFNLPAFRNAVENLKKQKITKTQVAESIGKNSNTFSMVLQGRTKLNLEMVLKFSELYGFDPETFIIREAAESVPVVTEHSENYGAGKDDWEIIFSNVMTSHNNIRQSLKMTLNLMDLQAENLKILMKTIKKQS